MSALWSTHGKGITGQQQWLWENLRQDKMGESHSWSFNPLSSLQTEQLWKEVVKILEGVGIIIHNNSG